MLEAADICSVASVLSLNAPTRHLVKRRRDNTSVLPNGADQGRVE